LNGSEKETSVVFAYVWKTIIEY